MNGLSCSSTCFLTNMGILYMSFSITVANRICFFGHALDSYATYSTVYNYNIRARSHKYFIVIAICTMSIQTDTRAQVFFDTWTCV